MSCVHCPLETTTLKDRVVKKLQKVPVPALSVKQCAVRGAGEWSLCGLKTLRGAGARIHEEVWVWVCSVLRRLRINSHVPLAFIQYPRCARHSSKQFHIDYVIHNPFTDENQTC